MMNKLTPFWLKYCISKVLYKIFRIKMKINNNEPTIMEFDETVNYIIDNKVSVSRFGDGEFQWIFQNRSERNFERNSLELSQSLLSVLRNDNEKLLVCIPKVFSGISQYNMQAREYWGICIGLYGMNWLKILNKDKIYADTQFTRPYMDYKSKSHVNMKFELLKKIWNDRNVLIVEGDKSRFGIGDDLLAGAKSIKRILAPSENAFESRNKIYKIVLKHVKTENDTLVLLSLGPTATVLASELTGDGVQAIDIGHLDIEYNWFLRKATKKEAIEGKYVNEIVKKGYQVDDIANNTLNSIYQSQIVDRVEA